MYSYIALLLMLPFLRSMVKNMQQKDFMYLTVAYIVFVGVLPCLEYLVWKDTNTLHESFAPVLFLTQNIFFALMGYYFEYVLDDANSNKRIMIMEFSLSIIAILITCFMTYYQMRMEDVCEPYRLERFFSCFICVPTMSVYYLIKHMGEKIKNKSKCKIIAVFGSSVFGVYLIEKFLRAIASAVYDFFVPYVGSFVASLLWCFATICLGFIIVIPLKNIPILKKVVNKFI